MEKQRKIKVLSIIALVVAVLGLTVAFAALSETLTINGTASVDAATWDVHFENLKEINIHSKYGTVVENSSPILTENSIKNIDVTISSPGDYLDYQVDIVNSGTVAAKVSSVDISPLCTLESSVESCDWDNDGEVTQEDVNNVNKNITFTYGFGFGETAIDINTIPSEALNPGNKIEFTIILNFSNDVDELPKRDLKFSDLSVTVNYVQTD